MIFLSLKLSRSFIFCHVITKCKVAQKVVRKVGKLFGDDVILTFNVIISSCDEKEVCSISLELKRIVIKMTRAQHNNRLKDIAQQGATPPTTLHNL